jgi:hypothetical protein
VKRFGKIELFHVLLHYKSISNQQASLGEKLSLELYEINGGSSFQLPP